MLLVFLSPFMLRHFQCLLNKIYISLCDQIIRGKNRQSISSRLPHISVPVIIKKKMAEVICHDITLLNFHIDFWV